MCVDGQSLDSGVSVNAAVAFLQIGCNAVSWGPAVVPGSLIDQPTGQKPNYVKRFVSGGCDNLVKLWKYERPL